MIPSLCGNDAGEFLPFVNQLPYKELTDCIVDIVVLRVKTMSV